MTRIYLDHNATTPLDPRVLESMMPHLGSSPANPSSLHTEGRAARRAVEDAREQVAAMLGKDAREVVFTSGATEANNLALSGMVPRGGRIAVSSIEHPSVLACVERLESSADVTAVRIPVDEEGRVSVADVDAALASGVDVVAVMAANNETGTLQPWAEIAQRCRESGCALHVDAVQMPGKAPLDVPDPGRGAVSLSGHKIGGPKGVGALWIRTDTRVRAQLVGGGQERQRRAGTENVAAIVGMGTACQLVVDEGAARMNALREAEGAFLSALRARVPDLVRHGARDQTMRLPGTMSLRIPGVPGEAMLLGCDLAGVAVSLGSACSSGAVEPSHVLAAMGINKVENLESFRVSLGWNDPPGALRTAANVLADVVDRNRRQP